MLDPNRLRLAVKDAARVAFTDLKRRRASERFYAFALYTAGMGEYVYPSANTEEGLLRRAGGYARRSGDAPSDHLAGLRWNAADWAYHLAGDEYFDGVDKLLAEAPDPYDLDDGACAAQVAGVFEACLSALAELDAEGVFGRGEEREGVVVNLLKGDQADQEMLEWARRLNPRPAHARLVQELGRSR